MNIANDWKDYEILDMASGEKLERWGNIYLVRPDPQIIWKEKSVESKWKSANARYARSSSGGGGWKYNKKVPENRKKTQNLAILGLKCGARGGT